MLWCSLKIIESYMYIVSAPFDVIRSIPAMPARGYAYMG